MSSTKAAVAATIAIPWTGLPGLASHPVAYPALALAQLVLLKAAQLRSRKHRRRDVDLAPLTRVQAGGLPEIKLGEAVALLGLTNSGDSVAPMLRTEPLFAGGKVDGMRSPPA